MNFGCEDRRMETLEQFLRGIPGGFRGGSEGIPRDSARVLRDSGGSACAKTTSFATSEADGSFPIIILKWKTH